jgi:hypothetical protein
MYVLYDVVEREAARQTNPTVDISILSERVDYSLE